MSDSAETSQRSGTDRDDTERRGHSERGDRRVGSPDRRLASVVKKMAQELQDLATVAEEEAVVCRCFRQTNPAQTPPPLLPSSGLFGGGLYHYYLDYLFEA